MEHLWRVAVGVAGLSAIVSFVFWSLYRHWLRAKALTKLNAKQLFRLFALFLCLTFAFAVAGLIVYLLTKRVDESIERHRAESTALSANTAMYVAYLGDRLRAGKALIEERREFIRSAMQRQRNYEERMEADGREFARTGGAPLPMDNDDFTLDPPAIAVTSDHLAALDRFEAQYTGVFVRLLEAAKHGDFVRCHEIAKDLRSLTDSPDAELAFSHRTVELVRAGMSSGLMPRYVDADDFLSLSQVLELVVPEGPR